jgi:hypothetical protein
MPVFFYPSRVSILWPFTCVTKILFAPHDCRNQKNVYWPKLKPLTHEVQTNLIAPDHLRACNDYFLYG